MTQNKQNNLIHDQCKAAKQTVAAVRHLSTNRKNTILARMAAAIDATHDQLLAANQADCRLGEETGLSVALLDRLRLTPDRLSGMAQGLRDIIALPDPVGRIVTGFKRPNGLVINQRTVPLGVIGIIYEARPNVTVDAIGLAIKSGNAIVLRGSASAYQSNQALVACITTAVADLLPAGCIQLLQDTSRAGVTDFLRMRNTIDVMIPRGGADLIQRVVREATMPTIETGAGICHVYIDQSADLDTAIAIAVNAKVSRPSVCNACETILVHESWATTGLDPLLAALRSKGVTILGCEYVRSRDASIAAPETWSREYLDLTVAIKCVPDISTAIAHINQYNSQHSDCIISQNHAAITQFVDTVDTACVLVNASTRFTDGGEFGYGTEMGISTQKLHVRGPVGLHHLVSTQYTVYGSGHTR